ncbi:MAG TPA: tyrosine-type recombinase/integrase, partial [Streptosporangiaceae bacterium]
GRDGLVFVGPKGARMRRSTFRRTWIKAREAIGMPELHFHDLRHTGNHWAAATGATIKELMARMGHSSTRAALIYLHATQERDKEIAKSVGTLVAKKLGMGQADDRIGHARGTRAETGVRTTEAQANDHARDLGLTSAERVTGVEPA